MTTPWSPSNHSLRFLGQNTQVAQATRDLLAKSPELLRIPIVLRALLSGTQRNDNPKRAPDDREHARTACLSLLLDNADSILDALQQVAEEYSEARGISHALRTRSLPQAQVPPRAEDLDATTSALDALTVLLDTGRLRRAEAEPLMRQAVEMVVAAQAPRDAWLRDKYTNRAIAACDLIAVGTRRWCLSLEEVRPAALWSPTPRAGQQIERALVQAGKLGAHDDSIEVERIRLALLHAHHPCREALGEMAWRYGANRERLLGIAEVDPETLDSNTMRFAVHAATSPEKMRRVLDTARGSLSLTVVALTELARYGEGHAIYADAQTIVGFVLHAIREGRAFIDKQYSDKLDGPYAVEVLGPASRVLRACARDYPASSKEDRVVLCAAANWLQDRTMFRSRNAEYDATLLRLVFALSMWDEASVEGLADLLGRVEASSDISWHAAEAVVRSLTKTQDVRSSTDEQHPQAP